MRDLGLMGESTFSLWCGDAGLIPNGSKIDKTGWDFYVEFPHEKTSSLPVDMQDAPIECKIQVKATDKRDRKLPIKLSNLRRLIRAPLPTFILFIEFDSSDSAKNAFLVHVDKALISKGLHRLREIEQLENRHDFNKRTITVKYNKTHKLDILGGEGLKHSILKYIPSGLDDYISNKKDFLRSTGFENGFVKFQFNTSGADNLKKLVNVSLGLEKKVTVEGFTGRHFRFGITDRKPFVECETGQISMPDIKPDSCGTIRFRDDKLSPYISFNANLYTCPFSSILNDSLKNIRLEGDFFDLVINPFTGRVNYNFSLDEDFRMGIDTFKNALILFTKLATPGNSMLIEMEFTGYPLLESKATSGQADIDFGKDIEILNCAARIANFFKINNDIDISFNELNKYGKHIIQFSKFIECPTDKVVSEFTVDGNEFNPSEKMCGLFFFSIPLGSYTVGMIVSLIGHANNTGNGKYNLIPENMTINRKMVTKSGLHIPKEDIENALLSVEKEYENSKLSIITMRS